MSKLRFGLFDTSPESLRVSKRDFRGDTLLPLTYSAQNELAVAHGSHAKALAQRHRVRMQSSPAEGTGTVLRRQLSVSDLHPSAGTNPETGRFDSLDDFPPYQQRQMNTWLSREWVSAVASSALARVPTADKTNALLTAPYSRFNLDGLRALRDAPKAIQVPLVLLGDVIDLLQTNRVSPGFTFPDGMVDHGRAPKNTPANAMVQLNIVHAGHRDYFRAFAMHLFLGHSIDFVPGNHDRALSNAHVWSGEIEVEGRKIYGFTKLLELELREIGATEAEIADSLSRLKLFPFILDADKLFEHGDTNDQYNKVRRPYKELIEPTPLHEEMELAYGDHGVRDGFNDIERARPTLDAIDRGPLFFLKALGVPKALLQLAVSFLSGATRDGYDVSPTEDHSLREQDIEHLIRAYPHVLTRANERIPESRGPMTEAKLVYGLQQMERVSARPFFSNFKRGAGFVKRLLSVLTRGFLGDVDLRGGEKARLDRIEAAHRFLGVNDYIDGHTHVAQNEYYLTQNEQAVRHLNGHTWTSKKGNWQPDGNYWGEQSRGVIAMMSGVTAAGIPFADLDLFRVVDESAVMVMGELVETYERDESAVRKAARAIYDANKPTEPAAKPSFGGVPHNAKLLELVHDPKRVR